MKLTRNYTPGPWEAVLMNEESDATYIEMPQGEDAVVEDMCFASACTFVCPITAEAEFRIHANATLIAAAPDMVEALVAMLEEDDGGMAAVQAKAALKKAGVLE